MFLQKAKVTKKRPDAKLLFCAAAHRPFGRGTPVSGGGDGQKYAFFTDRPNVSHKKVIFADMELRVKQVREVTGPLLNAFARLMPQLSPRLAASSAARLREIAASPSAALFAAEAGGCVRGLLPPPCVVRRAVGPQGMDRGCRGRCRSPRNGGGAGPRGRRTETCGGCRGGRSPADLEPCAGGRAGALS